MQKRYIAIVILCFFLISMISILGSPLAATYHRIPTNTSTTATSDKIRLPKIIVSDETQHFQSEQANGFVELYLNETTPLTAEYLINNPTYRLNLSYTNILSLYLGGSLYKEQIGYSPSSISSEILQEDYEADPTNAKWKEPLTLRVYKTGYYTIFDVSLTEIVIDDPTDPTDPTNPDHGGSGTDIEEDDNSGLISGIVDGIGGFFEWIWDKISTFFSELFKPITDFIAQWKERLEAEDDLKGTIFDALGVMWDKLMGYTMEPILEFFDDVLNVEAIALVMSFWEIPILKDFSMASVVVLVIIAFFILCTTL